MSKPTTFSERRPLPPAVKGKAASSVPQLPWMWLAIGGGLVWMLVLAVLGLQAIIQEWTQPDRPPQLRAVDGALAEAAPPKPRAQELVALPPKGGAVDEPQQVPAKKELDLTLFANCQQIGTDVLFVKNPPDAFKRARAEKKMVFMVHLSGNLEDKEFT